MWYKLQSRGNSSYFNIEKNEKQNKKGVNMKPKNLHTKLSFKKLTISNLCPDDMGHLKGGENTYTCTIEICTLTWYVSCRPKNC